MNKKNLLMTLFLLFSFISTNGYSQIENKPKRIEFEMSSLNDKVFIATGSYKGEIKIYNDFIELNLNKGTINIQNLPNAIGKPFIRKISVGLARFVDNNGQWDIYSNSLSFPIFKQMDIGESHELPILKFLIPRDKNINLTDSWITITIENMNIVNGKETVIGTCHTHSKKDLFKTNQIEWAK